MQNRFLIADTHMGHSNIIRYCNRGFKDAEEMDRVIIDNWNSVVKPGDIVYILGDFCWGDPRPYVEQLNGELHLILGNHDRQSIGVYNKNFSSVNLYKEIKIDGNSIVLFHYPIASWNRKHYGSFHCHGHCHGTYKPNGRMMDVGVDTNNFYPYNVNEVVEQLSKIPSEIIIKNRIEN